MNYYEQCKSDGIKLELQPHRGTSWKVFKGKRYYFNFPLTKKGYQQALQAWYLTKAEIDNTRPNADLYHHHIDLFSEVLTYWDSFGTPTGERSLKKQVVKFIAFLKAELLKPTLQKPIPWKSPKEFYSAFFTTISEHVFFCTSAEYKLPDKWRDRISRINPLETEKKPQTIQYWYDAYFLDMTKKHEQGKVTDSTHKDRKYALSSFKKYLDLQAHVTTLGNGLLDKYDDYLQFNKTITRRTKVSYMKTAKMFVKYCSLENDCDLGAVPALAKKYTYFATNGTGRDRQAKKLLLWSVEDFQKALQFEEPYKCYFLLFLNCGFRHIDLSALQHSDIDHKAQRIVVQRKKLHKLESAPVVSYKLWDATYQSLKECQRTTGKFVFGEVHDSLKSWWKRNGFKKRLDYIRKTGSTEICRYDHSGLDTLYLGDCLTTTAALSYSFTDGEPCAALDRAIQHLGFTFNLASEPQKTIEVTPEMLLVLRQQGFSV